MTENFGALEGNPIAYLMMIPDAPGTKRHENMHGVDGTPESIESSAN